MTHATPPKSPAAPAAHVKHERPPSLWLARLFALLRFLAVVVVLGGIYWVARADVRVGCEEQQAEASEALEHIAFGQVNAFAEHKAFSALRRRGDPIAYTRASPLVPAATYRGYVLRIGPATTLGVKRGPMRYSYGLDLLTRSDGSPGYDLFIVGIRDNVVGDTWTSNEKDERRHVVNVCTFPGYSYVDDFFSRKP